ncbi:glutamate--cysteine ligase [Candidatus Erwinia haradaeae]|uniref:Glutamate--cysteine ligase n=1 Tax=Candidatus Erwinia haradaeae TaxID=1922217 RepID=A0A451DN27_9GAMM|nr:glutamate--cysteine ligase [Candidatus Erwinia haradaeae]VFP88181.1 Glutamate--cysteine ligase [Candidatus Erwinia haradaeae]
MIPDVSQALSWLESHPDSIKGIRRGIERETLRVNPNGLLATTPHPRCFGSPLTHKWITTDFAESLLELITPADDDIDHLLAFLSDLHRHTSRNLGKELMWPMSMPCKIHPNQKIQLAQYGSSSLGQMKTQYRQGLKNRYGALMQIIAGVHYNFSLPLSFWKSWADLYDERCEKEIISAGYLQMIRNYYRLGWVIPYLFGASPAICSSFMQGQTSTLPFEYSENGMLFLPYATSLRLSEIGYLNRSQNAVDITFNNLEDYVSSLKKATQTPSKRFVMMGVKDKEENRIQLNTNILQIEDELYIPIRPKRVTRCGEAQSDALKLRGIEYVEVRALDINPFSPIGITSEQIRFLDMFLIWCAIAEAPNIDSFGLLNTRKNWDLIITEGRKCGQTINIDCQKTQHLVSEIGKNLLYDLNRIGKILDNFNKYPNYQKVCQNLQKFFDNPNLTYSGRLLPILKSNGIKNTGLSLALQYKEKFNRESLEVLKTHSFINEAKKSKINQEKLEATDTKIQKLDTIYTIYN